MKKLTYAIATIVLVAPLQAFATQFRVEITNLTNANYFTPLLVAAHSRNLDMFEQGEPASDALEAIAEGGTVGPMQDALLAGGASVSVAETPTGAPVLAPGATAVAIVDASRLNRRLSLAAMILPTNDAFVGLDSVNLRGLFRRTFLLNGYDAGTEANDEILNPGAGGVPDTPGIPGDPAGFAGSGGTGVSSADTNETVHIHRGIVGDSDPNGGISDLDQAEHRWLNPVARVVITRIYNY